MVARSTTWLKAKQTILRFRRKRTWPEIIDKIAKQPRGTILFYVLFLVHLPDPSQLCRELGVPLWSHFLIVNKNVFVENILPGSIVRTLTDEAMSWRTSTSLDGLHILLFPARLIHRVLVMLTILPRPPSVVMPFRKVEVRGNRARH